MYVRACMRPYLCVYVRHTRVRVYVASKTNKVLAKRSVPVYRFED